MSSEVQTMADLGDTGDTPVALQTPLYPILSVFGLLMVVGTFLTWASVEAGEGEDAVSASVTGMEAGGWGLGAIICGLAIMALGIVGYFVNPFNDPEAMLIAFFGGLATLAALLKIANSQSLYEGEAIFEIFDAPSKAGLGLWLILLMGIASVIGAVWILMSRPRAQARLT